MPTTNFTIQSCNIPGLSVGRLDHPNPAHNTPLQGDRAFFADFTFTFLVTEDLRNYKDIRDWMLDITNHDSNHSYSKLFKSDPTLGEGLYSDATLTILNSKKNPRHRIQFKRMYPTQLSDILLDSQTNSDPVKAQCTMTFKDYTIEDVG